VLSINQGQVLQLTATGLDYNGTAVIVDFSFASSNANVATVSSSGAVCGGTFDSNNIVCNSNQEGQATITVTSGSASATATVYVHKQVDRVVITPINGCSSMGALLNPTASAYNTSSPGCSAAAPCDITSSVGPFTYGSGNLNVASSAAGINPTYDSASNSPTYAGGGNITGSTGQTCTLTDFSVGGGTGIDPIYSPSSDTPTYVSGGVINGSAGQTCTLTNFNGLIGASATVTLTGDNGIAPSTHLAIATPGTGGGTTAPTVATLGNGSATCSGTANVKTSLLTTTGINPLVAATATVSLTGPNVIAAGTHLDVSNQGYGAVTAPTTATLSNGSATCSGTASVITRLNSVAGLSAQNPGSTVLFAGVAGVNSVGTPFTVCPVTAINIHDAYSSNTNFSLTGGQTQNLTADVVDSMGVSIKPPLTWGSTAPGAVKVGSSSGNAAGITGVAPGSTTVTATCINPTCNIGLPPVFGNDVVTASVAGTSATTVYAASTKSLTLAPISTSNNAVGTAITLPALPNSILATQTKLFLGADSGGVMALDTASNAITRLGVSGKVLAASADGNYLLVSDTLGGATYFYNLASNSNVVGAVGSSPSGLITPDSNWGQFITGQNLVREGNSAPALQTGLSYTPSGIAALAQGSLLFLTSSGAHSIDVRSTCDQSEVQTLSAGSPTLVQAIPNGSGAVVVDPPNLDVITTPQPAGSCPVIAGSTLSSHDLQAGSFTPLQLFVSYDSSHAWVIGASSSLLSYSLTSNTPTAVPIAGGFTPLSGGITLDSAQVYLGAGDNKVHRINVASLSDDQQYNVNLTDSNSNPVAPDLVAVQPK
jgi:hypothetical protein